MINQQIKQLKPLVKRARELYPQSRSMRKQWVRHTHYLINTGRHAFKTGGFMAGQY